MNNFNVIGDIAGNYLTLLALLDKMPKDANIIALGDINDRGPRTKEVIEFFLVNEGMHDVVASNHGHMMVEEWKQQAMPGAHPRYYHDGLWPRRNGGMDTMKSYGNETEYDIHKVIPKEHIDFLERCPGYIETENFVMTHAPIHVSYSPDEAVNLGTGFAHRIFDQQSEQSVLWNRQVPHRVNPKLKGKINLFGHNASDKVKVYTTEFPSGIKADQAKLNELLAKKEEYPVYAIALDTSHGPCLTGLHLPTMTIYQQEYID
jgi:serine/threonine protein phosphatase 1